MEHTSADDRLTPRTGESLREGENALRAPQRKTAAKRTHDALCGALSGDYGSNQERVEFAREYLKARDYGIEVAGPSFIAATDTISSIYSHYAAAVKHDPSKAVVDGDGRFRDLPVGRTRLVYLGLLTALSADLKRELGPPYNDLYLSSQENPTGSLFRFFGWSFNRMKQVQDTEGIPDVHFPSRGKLGDAPLPYTIHTHFELPFTLTYFGMNKSPLTLMAALGHDIPEEGSQLVVEGTPKSAAVDLDVLSRKFPEQSHGQRLRTIIPALTETEYDLMESVLLGRGMRRALDDYQSFARERGNHLLHRDRVLEKAHIRDPIAFGGLAHQIATLGNYFEEAATTHEAHRSAHQEILESTTAVEFADRLSDICSISRYLDWNASIPEEGRFKILAILSRMTNMADKLEDQVCRLPTERQESFSAVQEHFPLVLAAKIEQINEQLTGLGLDRITADEWIEYHSSVFEPIQRAAEQLIDPIIREKVERMSIPALAVL